MHFVLVVLDPRASGEQLYAIQIDRVDVSAVVRQQRSQRPPDDLRAIDDRDRLPEQPVPVRDDRVVNLQVFKDFDYSQRRAGKDRLVQVGGRIEEADVLVHVEHVCVGETLDVLGWGDELLDIVVLARGRGEDGVVDYYAVDGGVGVGGEDGFFDVFFGDGADFEEESAGRC